MANLAPSRQKVANKIINGWRHSHSQIGTFCRCRRLWAFQKLLGIEKTECIEGLEYGAAGHEGLQALGQGRPLDEAILIALRHLESKAKGQEWYDKCVQMLPLHLKGFHQHCWPGLMQKYEIVGAERELPLHLGGGVSWVGKLDITLRNRQTRTKAILDYKFSSDQYASNLKYSLNYSHQLATYLMADYTATQEMASEVGYIFLKKLKKNANPLNLLQDPGMYEVVTLPVNAAFIAFAQNAQVSDAAYGREMLGYAQWYAQHGLASLQFIPADFENCNHFGEMCEFAQGCHSGQPIYTQMQEAAI